MVVGKIVETRYHLYRDTGVIAGKGGPTGTKGY